MTNLMAIIEIPSLGVNGDCMKRKSGGLAEGRELGRVEEKGGVMIFRVRAVRL